MAAAYQQRPDLSLPQLGKMFGGRDHTTILYAVRKAGAYRGGAK
jgi:chromosomal replication initiation ATPase DnaA